MKNRILSLFCLFCRHPGRCIRNDLLGQRVRSNHFHTVGSIDAADAIDAYAGHSPVAADAANPADSDAG